jgi:hypothetical protein
MIPCKIFSMHMIKSVVIKKQILLSINNQYKLMQLNLIGKNVWLNRKPLLQYLDENHANFFG